MDCLGTLWGDFRPRFDLALSRSNLLDSILDQIFSWGILGRKERGLQIVTHILVLFLIHLCKLVSVLSKVVLSEKWNCLKYGTI